MQMRDKESGRQGDKETGRARCGTFSACLPVSLSPCLIPYNSSMPNPLHDLHRQAEAEFQPYGNVEIVSTFGEPQAEYAAIRKSCGMIDLPQRGVIEVTGRDRLPFLNNLLSNQTFSKEA